MFLRVLVNATTAGGTAAPTLETQGVPIQAGSVGLSMGEGFLGSTDEAMLLLEAQKSGGTLSVGACSVYLWMPESVLANKWFKAFDVNGGAAFAEGADGFIRHTERIRGFREGLRMFCQHGALGGTTPRLDVTLVGR